MYESLLPLLLLIKEGESVRVGRALSPAPVPVPGPLTNEREGEGDGEGEGEAAHTVLSSISDITDDGPWMRGLSDSSFENVRVIRTCSDPLEGCWKTCCVCCVCGCCIDDEDEDGLVPLLLLSPLFLLLILLDAVLSYVLELS